MGYQTFDKFHGLSDCYMNYEYLLNGIINYFLINCSFNMNDLFNKLFICLTQALCGVVTQFTVFMTWAIFLAL